MSLDDLAPTITVEHAGEILGISRRSAHRAANRGEIPTLRIGSEWLETKKAAERGLRDVLGQVDNGE